MGRPVQYPELEAERLQAQMRRLPMQLVRARSKLQQLEDRARAWRMNDLIEGCAEAGASDRNPPAAGRHVNPERVSNIRAAAGLAEEANA